MGQIVETRTLGRFPPDRFFPDCSDLYPMPLNGRPVAGVKLTERTVADSALAIYPSVGTTSGERGISYISGIAA